MPQSSRPSLRGLARQIGTSHQLLSFHLRSMTPVEEAKSEKLSGRMLEKYIEELCKTGHGKEAVELLKLAKQFAMNACFLARSEKQARTGRRHLQP